MISEQEFVDLILCRVAPVAKDLLDKMFGPCRGRIEPYGLKRVGKEWQCLPTMFELWDFEHNVFLFNDVRSSDVVDLCGQPGQTLDEALVNLIRVVRKDVANDGNPQFMKYSDALFVLSLDGGHVLYFFSVCNFSGGEDRDGVMLRMPGGKTPEEKQMLSKFYHDRIKVLNGRDWKGAFFMPDLFKKLNEVRPAKWTMVDQQIHTWLSYDVEVFLDFCWPGSVSFSLTQENRRRSWNVFDIHDVPGVIDKHIASSLLRTTQFLPEQEVRNKVQALPMWACEAVRAALLSEMKGKEEMIAKHEETIASAKSRIEVERDVLAALQAQCALWETPTDANP